MKNHPHRRSLLGTLFLLSAFLVCNSSTYSATLDTARGWAAAQSDYDAAEQESRRETRDRDDRENEKVAREFREIGVPVLGFRHRHGLTVLGAPKLISLGTKGHSDEQNYVLIYRFGHGQQLYITSMGADPNVPEPGSAPRHYSKITNGSYSEGDESANYSFNKYGFTYLLQLYCEEDTEKLCNSEKLLKLLALRLVPIGGRNIR